MINICPQLKTRLLFKINILRKFSTNINSTTDFQIFLQKRGITTFRSKFFVSQYRKISLGNTSVYQKLLCFKKFYASEGGGITFLGRKLFVTQYRKISLGYTSVYQKISGFEKFYESERRGITFLRRKFFVTQYQKISLGNTSVFQKISCIAKFYA